MKKAYAKPRLGKVALIIEEAVLTACNTDPHECGGQNGPGSWYADCADTTGGLTPCYSFSC